MRVSPTRAVPIATVAYVLGWAAHMTLPYFLAPLALRRAGAEGLDVWVFAAVSVASMLVVVPAGRLADRIPRRRTLRAGLGLLGASYLPLLLPEPGFAACFVGAFLSGAGLVATVVAFNSYVADLLPGGRVSAAFGQVSALATLAGAAGPLAAAGVFRFLDDAAAIQMCAALFIATSLAALLVTLLLPAAPAARQPQGRGMLNVWREERATVRPAAYLYALLGVGYGATYPYFAVYFLDTLDTPATTWGLLLGLGTLAGATGALAAGFLARRVPPRIGASTPQALMVLATLAFAFPAPFLVLAAAFVARNLFANSLSPIVNGMVMTRVAATSRARSQAWTNLGWNAGWTAGTFAGGALLAVVGGWLFPLGALAGLAGVAWGMAQLSRGASPQKEALRGS